MDRLSDLKLATGDVLKAIGPVRRRAASSCNAFAIATFSSFYIIFAVFIRLPSRLGGETPVHFPLDAAFGVSGLDVSASTPQTCPPFMSGNDSDSPLVDMTSFVSNIVSLTVFEITDAKIL